MGDVKNFRFKTSQGNYDIPVKDTTARERIGDLEQLQTPHKDNLVNAINDLEGGGSGGTSDYTELNNKPSINGVTLVGNKTTEDLGIEGVTDYDDLENRPVESSDLDIDAVVYPLPEDLTQYVTESEFTETLSNYTNTTDLTTLLNAKQDTLTFDNVPTQSSNNPVKSGGVYSALYGETQTTISVSLGQVTTQATLYKNGKTCTLHALFDNLNISTWDSFVIGTLPEIYRPKHGLLISCLGRDNQYWDISSWYPFLLEISASGIIKLHGGNNNIHYIQIDIQWSV